MKRYSPRRLFRTIALTSSVLVASAVMSFSLPLPPNGFLFPPPNEPDPVGAVQVDQLILPYVGADIQGTLISTVWAGDVNNLLGGLTFTYEILAGLPSTAPIERFTVGNFGLLPADASYRLTPALIAEVAPTYAGRTPDGNVISFDFSAFGGPGIYGGQESALLVIQSSSPTYQQAVASVINAGAATVDSFAPIAVPEPTALSLLIIGSLSILGLQRRK